MNISSGQGRETEKGDRTSGDYASARKEKKFFFLF
jgi:hypothetical protein